MIKREEILSYAEQLPGCVTDQPFEGNFSTIVLRHKDSGKWFGVLLNAPCRRIGQDADGDTAILNLKCAPEEAMILCELYPGILPAYHMNKRLWITLILSSSIPPELWKTLLLKSYDLTRKKKN